MDVAIVGGGAWGSALACHAARLGHGVRLWAREREVVAQVNTERRNDVFLPGVTFPEGVRASSAFAEVLTGAGMVILVMPSQHLREVTALLAADVPPDALVVVATKGIESATLELMSQVAAESLPGVTSERLAVLSGPSFAREVAAGLQADVVVASEGAVAARAIQPHLHHPMLRVYTGADPIGVELGGAIKNVIAIATGACDGLGLGANARAALITRGLAEITRLGVALGADPLTFLGLAGVGDLVLTCTGDLSRNRTLGLKLAEGVDAASYVASQPTVAEGYATTAAAYRLARKVGVEMPVTEQLYHVLYEGRRLEDAVRLLVGRTFKDELHGIRLPIA